MGLRQLWRRWKFRKGLPASIRLVISDVDGTLVSGEEPIPASTAALLRGLEQAGLHFALASARPYPSIAHLAQHAGLAAWIISLDGALLHSPTGELLFAAAFPEELLDSLLELGSHYRLEYAAFTPEELLSTPGVHIPSYLDDPGLRRRIVQLRRDFFQSPVVMLWVSAPHPQAAGFLKALDQLPRPLRRQLTLAAAESTSLPGTTLLELRMRTADKGTAAEVLRRHLRLPRSALLAVGDFRNDLPLFRVCGYRVAMADAVAELRSQADWVTSRPASERGIEELLLLLQEARR
ncbi:Putative phosphatase [bacterium HR21]|nr:Putative phosphatase [bacterium HR21]